VLDVEVFFSNELCRWVSSSLRFKGDTILRNVRIYLPKGTAQHLRTNELLVMSLLALQTSQHSAFRTSCRLKNYSDVSDERASSKIRVSDLHVSHLRRLSSAHRESLITQKITNTCMGFSLYSERVVLFEKLIFSELVKKQPICNAVRMVITCSQQPTTFSFSEPDQSKPHLPIIFL